MRSYTVRAAIVLVVLSAAFASCRRESPAAASADSTFTTLAGAVVQDYLRRHPSAATDLGIHDYDDRIEDVSQAAREAESATLKAFRQSLTGIDPAALSLSEQLDREQLIRSLDAEILSLDVIQPWRKDPDSYSSGVTRAAYVIMKRPYAPAADRLRSLIARQKQMPAVLAAAKKTLENPPRIYTEIAIEQIDGNISLFKADLPAAFEDVTDPPVQTEFASTNAAVIAALEDYKTFLEKELLPRSNGSFAWGADTYVKALAANEMIELPLDRLLTIAEQDLQRNEAAFQATAREIDASKAPDAVLASLQRDHPQADTLLDTTQNELDSLRRFIVERRIMTIPTSEPAIVKETPPFMRSTTSASMDTPGPFEKAKLPGFYHMTLPDPRWGPVQQADFMRAWYRPAITIVSVHEVYPGHYLQFLYASQFSSDVRKVFGAASNSEGWAHYSEQMMLDEGFHSGERQYRLAQLQDREGRMRTVAFCRLWLPPSGGRRHSTGPRLVGGPRRA